MKGHKKIWKTGIFLPVIFLLGMGAGMVLSHKGISDTKNSVLAHTTTVQELRTDKIAVVNLDTGIAVGDENINYAGSLLVNLPDNFLLTGLEDARQGLKHGLYAGYLVVPATFSQNIVSLNETPVRAEISYMINDDLTAEYKEKAIYSVLEFVSNLNDNVSYMYLNSLMDEFHDAQNESEMIMKNDQGEREAIDAIQAKDLISLIPVTEVSEVEYDIQPVDITEYMTKNAELTGQVGTKYMEYLQASEVDHQKLIVQSTALMEEMQNMDGIIMGVNLALDAEGNSVYQTGEEKLSTLFEEHNQKLMEKEQALDEGVLQIYTDVQNYLSEYERSINAYQEENQEKYLDTLTALENLFHEYQSSYVLVPTEQYVQMKDALAAAMFSAENGEQTETPEPPVESGTVELSELQKQMQDILVDHYYIYSDFQVDENGNIRQDEQGNNLKLTDLLAEYKKDLNNEEIKKEILDTRVGEIEKMDIAEVRNIVDSDILQPIQNNTDTFIQNVSTQYAKEKEQLREFGEAVVNYNPVKYINHEEIQGLTGEMYENGTELYKAIIETDIQQEEYVRDVYEATRADLDTMQDNVVQAKEDSDQAVEKGLEELKQIKHSNSVENQEILLDFSKKLPYTRLGSLEYRQAYEFMANPVGYRDIEDKAENVQSYVEDTVKQEKDSVSIKEYQEKDIEKIVTVIMSMICVIIVISTVKYHFHKKEEPYEV